MEDILRIPIDELGRQLSLHISCGIKLPPYQNMKPVFVCGCGINFPHWIIRAAIETDDWATVKAHHTEGAK